MTLGGKRGNPKAGFPLFPPSLEIAPRFPHSHRHDYGFILVQAINYTPLNCHPCCRAKVLPMSPAAPTLRLLRALAPLCRPGPRTLAARLAVPIRRRLEPASRGALAPGHLQDCRSHRQCRYPISADDRGRHGGCVRVARAGRQRKTQTQRQGKTVARPDRKRTGRLTRRRRIAG